MATDYLKEVRESLEVSDSETFKDIFFDYKKASLPACLNTVFESVSELAEFIIVVEEAGNFDGLKEIMENMLEETGVNLLTDSEGREPDMETMTLKRFKDALIHRFDTDNFNSVKEGIISDFLMPTILKTLLEQVPGECSGDEAAQAKANEAGWIK
jgi:hypothetical protein